MQDQAPRNRAERRAAARKRAPAAATLVRPQRAPHSSQSAHPGQVTGTGAPSGSDSAEYGPGGTLGPQPGETWAQAEERVGAELRARGGMADTAPTRSTSHKAGGSKQQRIWEALVSYYALAGLAVSRRDQQDGMLIVGNAEKCADAWIAAGKGNPQIMRALEMVTIAGPYTALVTVHVTLLFSILDRHGANPFAKLFEPRTSVPAAPARSAAAVRQQGEPAPLPYTPVGANAPTEAPAGPAQYQDDDFLVIPDEGIPAEIDVALREMARATGRPYQELRQEALVELAQMRMQQQNGHSRVQTPGALGAPVARE
jgi:hypothetical protein